jgi:polysaccharide deacetylase family protein (PEP-CTERM system associated)
MSQVSENVFLFSVDVEDDRPGPDNQNEFSGRVPGNVDRYLDFLKKHRMTCTFFVLGNIARKYPDLLRKIEDHGHEIACHSDQHRPMDQLDKTSFKVDLERNLAAIKEAGIAKVSGFRAPFLSLTESSSWAHGVLAEMGFTYSSSVLPAKNPHYGWDGFAKEPTLCEGGVWEIPITLSGFPVLNVPFGGGVYFRALPYSLVATLFSRTFKRHKPVVSYFHPYDIDLQQRPNAFPEFADRPFFNWLMYVNRKQMFKRLEGVLVSGARICRYDEYVASCLNSGSTHV